VREMAEQAPLKEATIKVLKIKEEKWKSPDGDKPYWKIIDAEGNEWSLWNKQLREHIKEGESYPVKYSEKSGKEGEVFKSIQQIVGVELKRGFTGQGRLSFAEEMEKQRIIAAQCVFKTFKEAGDWKLSPDETMAWIMGKLPETRQESNPVAPGNASKSVVGKPSEGDPEKRKQTVIGAIQKLLPDAMKRQVELDSFAKSQNWPNKIAIAQDSLNALNISQLGEFYNHLKEAK